MKTITIIGGSGFVGKSYIDSFNRGILKKFKIKKKLIANNLTSILINMYNFGIFFISLEKYDESNVQLLLILTNIIIYISAYIYLYKYKKNFNYSN